MLSASKAHRPSKKEKNKKKQEQKLKEGQPDKNMLAARDEGETAAIAEGEEEVGVSRFPAAMMLAAGLAIASSVVGRSHS